MSQQELLLRLLITSTQATDGNIRAAAEAELAKHAAVTRDFSLLRL